jgi:AcrR family transcriptional regulator
VAAERREKLIDTAARLVAEHGVTATSPRDVMTASGVGQGSLYHHFPTKADLVEAALDQIVSTSLDKALTDITQPGPALQALLDYLQRPRNGPQGCRVGRHATDEQVLGDARLSGHVSRYFLTLHAALVSRLEGGASPTTSPDAESLADLILATVQGGYVLARATQDQRHMDRAVSALVVLLGGTEHAAPDRA